VTVLEVVSRAALALLGASLAVMLVGSLRRAWRSIRGMLAGTLPDPERWTFTIPPGQPAVLGRQEGRVDVCLPDLSVARRHAQVQVREGSWHIEDLGSHCGVFVNDVAIHGQKIIRPGDVVRVGRVRLTVLAADTSTGRTALREAIR
jgi:hypothetical protein